MSSGNNSSRTNESRKFSPQRFSKHERPSLSEQCYGEDSLAIGSYDPTSLPDSIPTGDEIKKYHTKQSRRIPQWAWFLLAKSLGIKTHQFDRVWFGTLMHTVTVTCALGYLITNTWYIGHDISSAMTKQTILSGSVLITLGVMWCSMGIYANILASNLFSNRKFVDCVRMHTKTIFKISAAMIMIILSFTLIILNNIRSAEFFTEDHCETLKVGLNPWVCHIMYVMKVAYSVLCLIWNLLVGIVLLSVCRTHTIGIRRFIRQLEDDGRLYLGYRHLQALYAQLDTRRLSTEYEFLDTIDDEHFMWDEDELTMTETRNQFPQENSGRPLTPRELEILESSNNRFQERESDGPLPKPHEQINPQAEPSPPQENLSGSPLKSCMHKSTSQSSDKEPERPASDSVFYVDNEMRTGAQASNDSQIQTERQRHTSSMKEDTQSVDSFSAQPRQLSNEEILMGYWKISCRLRATSLAMQRWLASWIGFVVLWSATYIIYWLSHTTTVIGMVEFAIPLTLLGLISSAFAEVNNEGKRFVQTICPKEDRVSMLRYLNDQPLAMTVFGFAITYSSILTVIVAFALALSSRIILDEFVMPLGLQTTTAASVTTMAPTGGFYNDILDTQVDRGF